MIKGLLFFVVFILGLGGGMYYLSERYPEHFGIWLVLLLVISIVFGSFVQPRLNMYPVKVIAERTIERKGKKLRIVLEEITRASASRYNPVLAIKIHDYRWVLYGENGKRADVTLLGQDENKAKKMFAEIV